MNQEKIGKFIQELRREKDLTQSELASKLNVTDRAISKWENGRGLPDLSLIKPLCEELDISINELLSGEKLSKKEYLAQVTLSKPRKIPVAIVEPEREMPGIDARPWAIPIIIAVFKSILSVFALIFSEAHSPKYNIHPVTNKNIPTTYGRFIRLSETIFNG